MIVKLKNFPTVIKLLTVGAIFFATVIACEEQGGGGEGGQDVRPEKEVDNASINPAVFDLLDKDNSSMAAIVEKAGRGEYFYAAQALRDYYRNRTSVIDPEISLIAPKISASEQAVADAALAEKTEVLLQNPALDWIAAQGLAYRVSHDEKYAKSWTGVMDKFIDAADTLAWDGDVAAVRVNGMISAWQYFMQSPSVTPAFTSKYLAYFGKEAARMAAGGYAPTVLGRAALVFPEFAGASEWAEMGKDENNKKYKDAWFNVLNLDYPGLEAVKTAYGAGDKQAAAEALLAYWRTRVSPVNPSFDITSALSDTEKHYADQALKENGYRFYVKNYYENSTDLIPYSYSDGQGGINWQYWPTKDQEQRYQVNRHEWMPYQAKAYYATKNEKYVTDWMATYQDFHKQNPEPDKALDYSVYPENQAAAYRNAGWTWRPLEVAIRVMGECDILDYVKGSASLTPEYLMWFLYELARQTNHVRTFYANTSNHLITEAQAVAQIGFLFPELKESEAWISSGCGKLNNEVTAQYYNDGWLKDGDFHYHISSIEDFRLTMLMAAENGKSSLFPASYKTAMKSMADVVVNMVFPDYSSVNMTDTRCATWTKSILQKNFNRYYQLFPDESSYLWLATGGASGTKPSNLAKNFPDCGYYVLRSGWEAKDIMMVLQNTTQSPNEKWHRQWDNNTFELYVGGRKFFQDSGCYTYTTGTNRSKYAATSAHNTLTLDGKNVTSCRGTMVKSTTDGNTDILVLSNPSYSGLTHRRTIFFVDRSFFVIVDDAIGTAAGTVNLNFHLPPVVSSANDVVVSTSDNSAHTAFSDGNNIGIWTVADQTISSTARTGFLSTNIDKTVERKSYQVDLAKTADMAGVRFVTVIYPCKDASAVSLKLTAPTYSASKVEASFELAGKTYQLTTNL